MPGFIYSVMGIIAIIIHLIINRKVLGPLNADADVVARRYRRFLWGVLAYYTTDTLWGLLDELGFNSAIKADTFVYYVAMALAVVLWTDYVVAYLNQQNLFGKIIRAFGQLFMFFETAALIVNIFYPFFFWFDADGAYHAGSVRYASLYIQIALFMVTTIQAVIVTMHSEGIQRRRHLAICMFGISMMFAIVVQIYYPLLPIYSIGYLIGGCFLHVFIEEDELDEHYSNLRKQNDIVSSMAGIYFCSYYVDMSDRTFVELDNKISENNSFIG